MDYIVAIVGRPNVGKSTLFNRINRKRKSLVDDLPGITRDRIYAYIQWEGKYFTIVDTGGLEVDKDLPIYDKVKEQVLCAIEEADSVIFMVDAKEGLMPQDMEIAKILRRRGKMVYLAVNKVDGPEKRILSDEFHMLGFEPLYPISALHGYGVKELMDDICKEIGFEKPVSKVADLIKVAVLGRPNVGKSSLINKILGFERMIVSEVPGTTRDCVDIELDWIGQKYLFIDTAGIRRRTKIKERIERVSAISSLKSMERADVVIVMMDCKEGITNQDLRICSDALERGKGLIVALNKWDLIAHDRYLIDQLEMEVSRSLKPIFFVPVVRISVKEGKNIDLLFNTIKRLNRQISYRVKTPFFNKILKDIVAHHSPIYSGRKVKIYYGTQVDVRPPTFVIFCSNSKIINLSYRRYISNEIRKRLELRNSPIRIILKDRR